MKSIVIISLLAAVALGALGCGGSVATTTTITTTTTAPTTTSTTVPPLARFDNAMEQVGPKIVDAIKLDAQTESVSLFDYDTESGKLVLIMSSTLTDPDNKYTTTLYENQAWMITRAIAGGVYAREIAGALEGTPLPTFRLELDGLVYEASSETMGGIANKEVSREAWLAAATR